MRYIYIHTRARTGFQGFPEQHEISRYARARRLYTTDHVRLITLRGGLKKNEKGS